jgi:transcription-repair coupling factor (superfamily II helicase)
MFESLKLYINQNIPLDTLIDKLIDYDYRPTKMVASQGDFSHRGGIVDIFPVTFMNPIRIELELDTIASIHSFDMVTGELFSHHKMVIVLPNRVRKTTKFRIPELVEEAPVQNFLDLEIGDFVVHLNYGIGRYRGLQKFKSDNGARYEDYLAIEYAGGDKLYVPVEEMHLVQRYVGLGQKQPRIYRLGSSQWQRDKNRTRKGIHRYARQLLELEAKRKSMGGFAFSGDTEWQRKMEESFPYVETADQKKTSQEIKRDMESPRPMDRLICGDVGYGKTEVAIRAAFKAVMDNKQVAMLVPTTILAQQHYSTFSFRLRDFPVEVRMLCRFNTSREKEEILQGLREGKVDIIIGTHALLSEEVTFRDLGLVIIDEEQRFGVMHKEKFKALRLVVDVLTLTATPIPRTLYMSLMGARDISVIDTPPASRLSVKTYVCEYSDDLVRQAILNEVSRGGQVFFVHNRILDIDKIYRRLSGILPQVRIGLGHGRLPSRQLEKVMLDFINGRVDVFLSTTIVESGIDIPNANTLVVNNAHQFGLADLHQLRGRVGRLNKQAFAYFLVPSKEMLAGDSRRRLDCLAKYVELGSGFKIAMEDLEIRGAGNILGTEQHGFISTVGFDLYCRLPREAINSLDPKRQ